MFVFLGPPDELLTLSVFKGRWEKSHPKGGSVISLKQRTRFGGLICVWHHLSASFGQDTAANDCGFVIHSPPLKRLLWRLCGDLPHAGQNLSYSEETASIFSWAKQKCFVCVFSLHKDLHVCVRWRAFWTSGVGKISFVFSSFPKRDFYGTCWPSVEQRTRKRQLCLALIKEGKSNPDLILYFQKGKADIKRSAKEKSLIIKEEKQQILFVYCIVNIYL